MQGDARLAEQPVQAAGGEPAGVEAEQPCREVVGQPGQRFPVAEPQPLQVDHLAALGELEGGGRLGTRRLGDAAQDAGGGAQPGRLQVVVETAQLQRTAQRRVQDLGADAPAADQQSGVDQ